MKQVTILIEEYDLEALLAALGAAEEEGEINGAFTVKVNDYPVEENDDE